MLQYRLFADVDQAGNALALAVYDNQTWEYIPHVEVGSAQAELFSRR